MFSLFVTCINQDLMLCILIYYCRLFLESQIESQIIDSLSSKTVKRGEQKAL